MLEQHIRQKLRHKPLLLMTHIVIGYPSFRESWALARAMVDSGVDLMELQIPFSEPMADGPVILKANQQALAAGATVQKCIEFATELSAQVQTPLLFMSYYNILFKYGVQRFTDQMKRSGLAGAIVPDLPLEEGSEYLGAMAEQGLSAVRLFAPNTPDHRMAALSQGASGMVYCVARKGVTGAQTTFSTELSDYLARARRSTSLPLGVGFGIKDRADIEFLKGKADIAIVGSESIRMLDQSGIRATGEFIKTLVG